jgi:hypothetical protein
VTRCFLLQAAPGSACGSRIEVARSSDCPQRASWGCKSRAAALLHCAHTTPQCFLVNRLPALSPAESPP